MSADAARAPSAVTRRERTLVVLTVLLGSISTLLASTIVNVAFPMMMSELRVGHDTIQWVATGFLAATTTTMLATAWGLERFGERITFGFAMVLFAAGSVLGAFAFDVHTLIIARVLQGAAAGVVQPMAMVALFRVFPPEERGRAMGLYGFGIVLAPAVGPALGGWLVDTLGWRAIFVPPLPFCVAALVLAWRVLAREGIGRLQRFDLVGTVALIGGLVALLNVPVAGHQSGWLSAVTLALAVIGVALAVAFVWWEARSPSALLRISLFRNDGFRGAALVAFTYGAGLFGTTYLLPVFVQQAIGFDAGDAGLMLAPAGIALAIAMVLGGRLADAFPVSRVIAGGLVLFALSTALYTFSGPGSGFWTLALWLVIGRVGLGLIIPALNVGAVQSLSGPDLAYGSAAVNFIRQLGGAVGVNLIAVLLEWRTAAHGGQMLPAFHECFWTVTVAYLVAVIPARWMGRR
jgi:EmrB/QacA subfamily drug resistance transporter